MRKDEYQKIIYDLLGARIIAYNADLAKVLGSTKTAILIGQLLYWQSRSKDNEWVYKTIIDMEEETGLSKHEQSTAIAKCKMLGILEYKLKGIPAKRHFRVDIEKLIRRIYSFRESGKLAVKKYTRHRAEKTETNTQSTQGITSQNTSEMQLKKIRRELNEHVTPNYAK